MEVFNITAFIVLILIIFYLIKTVSFATGAPPTGCPICSSCPKTGCPICSSCPKKQ